jgi:glycosyltransferase involved in cell wall biosynthesis
VRIIFINRYFYPDHSATSQLLSDLAFYLARNGATITVVTSRQVYDNPSARLLSLENVHGVRVVRIWTSRFGRFNLIGRGLDYLTFYASAFVRLLIEVKQGDVVVAETDPPLVSVVAWWVARWKNAKLVNWIQDLFPEIAVELGVGPLHGRLGAWLRRVRNASLMAADRNVVLGDLMRKRLLEEGVYEGKITVIPNWSDEASVYPVIREQNSLRHAWALADKFVVGYSGNMGRAHEFDAILDAADILRQRADIIFLFIGDGARRPWLEEQISSRNLTNVILKPYQPRQRLADSLSVPDIHFVSLKPGLEGLIVPSKFYGIIAAGRPVLFAGSRAGEIATIIEKAACGISVELQDARSLAAAVERLAENFDQCRRMGQNARMLFDEFYGMNKSLLAWSDVLQEVLGE